MGKDHQYFKANYQAIRSTKIYEKYLDEFCVSCNATIAYDATMDYLEFAADEKDGLAAVNYVRNRLGPDVKIMMMLRDPVEALLHNACSYGKQDGSNLFSIDHPPNGSRTIVQ